MSFDDISFQTLKGHTYEIKSIVFEKRITMNTLFDSKFGPRVFRVDRNTEYIKHRSD